MYNPQSLRADEFIDHSEVLETLAYATEHARDAEPRPWQDAHEGPAVAGQPGFQSDSAARRALRLHAAEARIPAIQGSISTRDRINQGKRDHRGDGGD